MSPTLFAIVIGAAFCHAGWNFAARRAAGNLAVLWWGCCAGAVAMAPLSWLAWPEDPFVYDGLALFCIGATGVIHAFYFLLLGKAYEQGEISVVYPLARGSGVALTPIGAVLILRESVSNLGAAGIACVVAGILLISLPVLARGLRGHGIGMAVGVGATIPAYSLIDKVGVGRVSPVIYIWLMYLLSSLLLYPFVRRQFGKELISTLRQSWGLALLVGLGGMLTYLLILYAYTQGPVGYIVALRECSVVVGAALGVWLLKEPLPLNKVAGIALIVGGAVCIRLA
ncbi:MAG: EamA family transporter [Candidatus Latescibacterota bacterium]|nr:EamA family transporter [Candidatus Latescibacterota bacterium]